MRTPYHLLIHVVQLVTPIYEQGQLGNQRAGETTSSFPCRFVNDPGSQDIDQSAVRGQVDAVCICPCEIVFDENANQEVWFDNLGVTHKYQIINRPVNRDNIGVLQWLELKEHR